MTLIEITNKLKHYTENQFSNPTVLVGSLYENMNTKELKYPVINFDSLSTTKRNNELVYNFSVFYADRLNEDSGNLLDVQSQGTTSLQLLLHNILDSGIISLDDFYAVEIQTYKMKFTDVCAGAYMQLNIHAMDDINYCDLPDVNTITITRNGEYDIALYEKANVDVQPSGGTIEITENGTYDVTDYTTAEVNVPIGDYGNYFYFQSREDSSKVSMGTNTTYTALTINLEYSFDKKQWQNWDLSAITVDSGQTVYFRGDNPNGFSITANRYYRFLTDGYFDIGGDIRSLIDKTTTVTAVQTQYCFNNLFNNCKIVNVDSKLLCGFKVLSNNCFLGMFSNCIYMTNAPELPFETLTNYCYKNMFSNCVSLTKAPDLPAKKLTYVGCEQMFEGCTSLNYIKCLATDISAHLSTNKWVNGVAVNGTFVRDYNATWTIGNSGIPTGWTVLVDNVPESVIQQ